MLLNTALLVRTDTQGKVDAVFEILGSDGQPYGGSVTGLAVSKQFETIYACGRQLPDEGATDDADVPFQLFEFSLQEVLNKPASRWARVKAAQSYT